MTAVTNQRVMLQSVSIRQQLDQQRTGTVSTDTTANWHSQQRHNSELAQSSQTQQRTGTVSRDTTANCHSHHRHNSELAQSAETQQRTASQHRHNSELAQSAQTQLQAVLYSQNATRHAARCTLHVSFHWLHSKPCGRLPSTHVHETRNVQNSCTNFHVPRTINMATTVRITFMPLWRFS